MSGRMLMASFKQEQLCMLAPTRNESLALPKKEAISRIERQIYSREFDAAFLQALRTAILLRQENRIVEANKLLNICYQRPMVEVPPSMPNPLTDTLSSINEFKYGSFFPPHETQANF